MVFLIAGTDPSICFGWRLTMDTTLSAGPGAVKIPAVPVCLTSFRTVVRMPYWKDRKQDGDTEWRIYYSHDALPLFPITVIDPSRSFRMTSCRPPSFSTFSWRLTANSSQLTACSWQLLSSYRFPHHEYRFFRCVPGDIWPFPVNKALYRVCYNIQGML